MTMAALLDILDHLELTQQCSVLSMARALQTTPSDKPIYDDEAAIEMAMRVCGILPDTGWRGTMDAGAEEYEEAMRAGELLKWP